MTLLQFRKKQGTHMGETYVELKLTNIGLFGHGKTTTIRALVDTGASHLIVTPEVAKALGYDVEELRVKYVNLADGRRFEAPHIEGLKMQFEDRDCELQAVVLDGNECLLGFIPLEAMDLIVDPLHQRLMGRHPEGQVIRVPSVRLD